MNDILNHTTLQPLLFDFNDFSLSNNMPLSKKEAEFASYWNSIASMLPDSMFETNRMGRKGYRDADVLAVRIVMLFFKQNNIKQTLSFLETSMGVRMTVGMENVPSESVVSRRSKELAKTLNVDKMFDKVTSAFFAGRDICNLSIDSTPIDAREKPVKKDPDKKEPKKKPGRKKKGSKEEAEYLARLAEEARIDEAAKTGDLKEFLSTLEDRCSITGKKNSKGYMQWRIGYKVHLAVDDFGIPVSYFISGACVHDSKVAVPLMRMARERARFLYALMDGGYSSSDIVEFTADNMDAVPVIDFKADVNGVKEEMDPAKKDRYKARTTVERTNSELKDCFLAPKLFSRGKNSIMDLKLAVLMLTMKKIKKVARMLEKRKAA